MKILNLYAGIGGNRKLWGDEHEVTAVENVPEIAAIYQEFFPKDKVVIADAHQYLLEHYEEFDFIWSSPPCPSHSRMRFIKNNAKECIKKYPDMKLYEEIIFLKHFFKGKWVVENVISYYKPLIIPIKSNNHYYWSNFDIPILDDIKRGTLVRKGENQKDNLLHLQNDFGFDFSNHNLSNTFLKKILNNCVQPKMGLLVFLSAFKDK